MLFWLCLVEDRSRVSRWKVCQPTTDQDGNTKHPTRCEILGYNNCRIIPTPTYDVQRRCDKFRCCFLCIKGTFIIEKLSKIRPAIQKRSRFVGADNNFGNKTATLTYYQLRYICNDIRKTMPTTSTATQEYYGKSNCTRYSK